jgi:LysM repeat protein
MKTLSSLGHRLVRWFSLIAVLLSLAACGKVATPQPTADTSSEGTSPSTPAPASHPTATAPLLTPVATATPTITSTPIVHIVQSGDTLLGIALDYGVSVEALQRANGVENPQMLRVGQELIIPTGEEEASPAPGLLLPTPTPLPFGTRGVGCYETPVGSLWCLGEIINTAAFTLTNVQVRVTLFDAAGEMLTEADVFAAADLIPPGVRSPFGILFTSPPAAWANPQVAIMRGEAAGELAASYVPIAAAEVAGESSGPQFQVTGIVRNDSAEQVADSVFVIATTYDAQGLVTGFRQGMVELEEPLTPGRTAPFTLQFSFHGDAPADFHVIALGRIVSE